MKTLTVEYNYYNHPIKQSINPAEMLNEMPPALRMETLVDILEDVNIDGELELFQAAIIKNKLDKVQDKIDHVLIQQQKKELEYISTQAMEWVLE